MSGSQRVILYTRPLCLLCHRVADLLRQACVLFKQVDVTNRFEQERISASFNAPSFPIVLVDGCYIGGYAHILQLHATGRLAQLGAMPASTRSDARATAPAAASSASISGLHVASAVSTPAAVSAPPSARSQASSSGLHSAAALAAPPAVSAPPSARSQASSSGLHSVAAIVAASAVSAPPTARSQASISGLHPAGGLAAASAVSAPPNARSQMSGSYGFPGRSRTSNMAILYESLKKDPPKENS